MQLSDTEEYVFMFVPSSYVSSFLTNNTLNGTSLHIGLLDYEHTGVETSLLNHLFKCEELEYHLERTVGI